MDVELDKSGTMFHVASDADILHQVVQLPAVRHIRNLSVGRTPKESKDNFLQWFDNFVLECVGSGSSVKVATLAGGGLLHGAFEQMRVDEQYDVIRALGDTPYIEWSEQRRHAHITAGHLVVSVPKTSESTLLKHIVIGPFLP